MKVTFNEFVRVIRIIVNMDNVDKDDLLELLNDWFELYKGTSHANSYGSWTVLEWAQEHFQEVSKDTHDFWLDDRGLAIFELQEKVKGLDTNSMTLPTF